MFPHIFAGCKYTTYSFNFQILDLQIILHYFCIMFELSILGFLHFTWVDLLDIIMVTAVIYAVFHWLRGTSAMNIFIAIALLVVVRIISDAIGMKMISSLLGTLLDMGALAIIIIFQPELRRFLDNLGRSAGNTIEKRSLLDKLFPDRKRKELDYGNISEIAQACIEMSAQKTGALIVIRRDSKLEDIIATGDPIDAKVSSRLIMNIFFKNSPLHDGAMIIGNDRIIAARCTLPISERPGLPARYGMRHKAAVGISERSDADVIVVSEQTGGISFVSAGEVTPVDSSSTLKLLIRGKQKEEEESKK